MSKDNDILKTHKRQLDNSVTAASRKHVQVRDKT